MYVDARGRDEGIRKAAVGTCVLAALWIFGAAAQAASPHHGFLGGPWEVVAKMGHEGDTLRLPLSVADENKAEELAATLPVMGTPIEVRLRQYLPNLAWETVAVNDPNGGPVAQLSLRGENLEQDAWLGARDVARQAISSPIGAVAIREVPAGRRTMAALQELTDPEVVGLLLVRLPEMESPLAYAVKAGTSVALPGSKWQVSVLAYVPHYSIDRESKKVVSLSEKPVNPAVEIRLQNGDKDLRQWLWSRFRSSPHKVQELPFPVTFVDFHLETGAGRYMLAVGRGLTPQLVSLKDGKRHMEPLELGQRHPFKDKRYSFAVEDVRPQAAIKTQWTNGSDVLLRPAVVATITQADTAQETVLELNKPFHHKTSLGTLVVLYRRVPPGVPGT